MAVSEKSSPARRRTASSSPAGVIAFMNHSLPEGCWEWEQEMRERRRSFPRVNQHVAFRMVCKCGGFGSGLLLRHLLNGYHLPTPQCASTQRRDLLATRREPHRQSERQRRHRRHRRQRRRKDDRRRQRGQRRRTGSQVANLPTHSNDGMGMSHTLKS